MARKRKVVGEVKIGGTTYEQTLISCGKKNCRCRDNEDHLHGPYWYALFRYRALGESYMRTGRRYIGKELPLRDLSEGEDA